MTRTKCVGCLKNLTSKQKEKGEIVCGDTLCKKAKVFADIAVHKKYKHTGEAISEKKYYSLIRTKYKQYKELEEKGYFIKKCLGCGDEFKAVSDKFKYCSVKCRRKVYEERRAKRSRKSIE